MLNQFKTMKKSLDNEVKLTEEMIEFAKGDYTIDRDFDLISEDLKKLSNDLKPEEDLKPEVDTGFESILDIQTAIKHSNKNTSSLVEEKKEILDSIKTLDTNINTYNTFVKAGVEAPEILKNISLKQDDMKSELDRQLKKLNKEIVESNAIARKLRKASSPIKEDVEIFPSDFIGF